VFKGLLRLYNPQLPRTMTIYSLQPAHTHKVFVDPLFVILVGPGVRMSSSTSSLIQEREVQRATSARSIRPGWEPQALAKWKPKHTTTGRLVYGENTCNF
jgi:hypothetical protein